MAAPVRQRPSRYLATVALLLVGLYLGVFLGPSATPSLGLDLRGGTQVTLTAHPICHGSVTKSALSQAVDIIRKRADSFGASGAEVNTQGSSNIVVSVPGKGHDTVVQKIGQTALLRFRQAMSITSGVPAPTPTVSPSTSTTVKPGKGNKGTKTTPTSTPTTKATGKNNKKGSGNQGLAISQALLKKHPKAPTNKSTKKPSTNPTTTPTTTPTTSTSPAPITPAGNPSTCGTTTSTNAPSKGSESRTVTPAFQKSFNNWNCQKDDNPTNGADDPLDYIIACEPDTGTKFMLAPAAVEGTDVSSASADLDSSGTGAWVVDIKFNGSGASAWQKVTEQAYNINGGQPQSTACTPPQGCNSVAIALDGQVKSAPYISQSGGIAGGQAQISGSFTQGSASDLADVLKYGALPLKFTQSDVQTVSPSLGKQQLRGGLIAGIIGLGLVIVFSLLYYRALGFVTVGSLAVSGLILYAVTTILGHSSVGYTLSLPGIAGFIVAVGITADSFVVFFERLRDEIREGRRLRSGVERAWPRARRTILSADTVSLLAAFILYVVSIGDVRGFAFTLGLSTISDLFIVFFFTKPLLTIMARWKAFDSGKSWTGVGKTRSGITRDTVDAPTRTRRPREREA